MADESQTESVTKKEVIGMQGQGSTGNFFNFSLDLFEGVVGGGVIGLGFSVVAGAFASLPGAFITVSQVPLFSTAIGALAFTGIAIHQIRRRLSV